MLLLPLKKTRDFFFFYFEHFISLYIYNSMPMDIHNSISMYLHREVILSVMSSWVFIHSVFILIVLSFLFHAEIPHLSTDQPGFLYPFYSISLLDCEFSCFSAQDVRVSSHTFISKTWNEPFLQKAQDCLYVHVWKWYWEIIDWTQELKTWTLCFWSALCSWTDIRL